jgi:hypothetical protein
MADEFKLLNSNHLNTVQTEFSTGITEVTEHCKELGVLDLKSGLDAGGRSIILHIGGVKVCGDFVEQDQSSGYSNYLSEFN